MQVKENILKIQGFTWINDSLATFATSVFLFNHLINSVFPVYGIMFPRFSKKIVKRSHVFLFVRKADGVELLLFDIVYAKTSLEKDCAKQHVISQKKD